MFNYGKTIILFLFFCLEISAQTTLISNCRNRFPSDSLGVVFNQLNIDNYFIDTSFNLPKDIYLSTIESMSRERGG
jgi:hypothetical protein